MARPLTVFVSETKKADGDFVAKRFCNETLAGNRTPTLLLPVHG